MTKVEFTEDEMQVLAQALDSYVRQHGVKVAANAAIVLQKLQNAAAEQQSEPEEEEEVLEKVAA